jgi:integrase
MNNANLQAIAFSLEPKGNQHRLHMGVPRRLQPIIGKPKFRIYLKTDDPEMAQAQALPIVAEWRERLVAAEKASAETVQTDVHRLTLAYEQYANKPLDEAGRDLFREMLAFIFQKHGGLTPVVQNLVLRDARGKAEDAVNRVKHVKAANDALQMIVGLKKKTHPFAAHLDAFLANADFATKRGAKAAVRNVQKFLYVMVGGDLAKWPVRFVWAKWEPQHPVLAQKIENLCIEDLDPAKIQTWLDARRKLEPYQSTSNALNNIRHYWNWCCHHRKAGLSPRQIGKGPFYDDIVFNKLRNPPVADTEKYAFTTEEVVKLYQQAKHGEHYQIRTGRRVPSHKTSKTGYYYEKRPITLALAHTPIQKRRAEMFLACIKLKAHHSIRLSAICGIRIEDVETDPETKILFFHITRDKTAAGQRVVPVHSKCMKLVKELIALAKAEGREFLIDTFRDEDGYGGGYVTQDFTALKTSMGYDKHYSEHCIRKTCEAQWEKARIPLKTRKCILGHAIKDITEGVGHGKYGSPVPLPDLQEAIEILSY